MVCRGCGGERNRGAMVILKPNTAVAYVHFRHAKRAFVFAVRGAAIWRCTCARALAERQNIE